MSEPVLSAVLALIASTAPAFAQDWPAPRPVTIPSETGKRDPFSVLSPRCHVRPQRVDLIRLEQLAPGRHGVLTLRHRGEEALALIAREFAQIGRALRIGHARTVAWSAVPCIRLRPALDLLRLERVLRRGKLRKGEQRRGQDCLRAIQSGIKANVQTDPPGSTLPSVSLFAEVPPPSPESTLTYCRPLCV